MLSTKSRLWLLPLTFVVSAACTVILPPDEKDDGVERCENSEECPDPGDNRLVAVCYNDEDLTQNAPGVCTNVYAEVNCDAETGIAAQPDESFWPQWWSMYQDARDNQAAYTGACDDENLGRAGCPAMDGACEMGLDVELIGNTEYCIDNSGTYKTLVPTIDSAGQDVQHAFCRAYFGCDDGFSQNDNFVCNVTSGKCEVCVPGADPENGGCVEMWVNGAQATTYTGVSCNSGSIEPTDIEVGMPNQAG
jgi:hypothetical protein